MTWPGGFEKKTTWSPDELGAARDPRKFLYSIPIWCRGFLKYKSKRSEFHMEVGGKHNHIVDAVDVAEGEIESSP